MQLKIVKGKDGLLEHFIIEMQGDLESRIGNTDMNGKFIGDLFFSKRDKNPILIVGHHILYGKTVAMDKPMLVMRKENDKDEFMVDAVVRKKLLFKSRPKPIIENVTPKASL